VNAELQIIANSVWRRVNERCSIPFATDRLTDVAAAGLAAGGVTSVRIAATFVALISS